MISLGVEDLALAGVAVHVDGASPVHRLIRQHLLRLGAYEAIRPDALQRLTGGGFLACDGDTLCATEKGRTLLNSVLSELLV